MPQVTNDGAALSQQIMSANYLVNIINDHKNDKYQKMKQTKNQK